MVFKMKDRLSGRGDRISRVQSSVRRPGDFKSGKPRDFTRDHSRREYDEEPVLKQRRPNPGVDNRRSPPLVYGREDRNHAIRGERNGPPRGNRGLPPREDRGRPPRNSRGVPPTRGPPPRENRGPDRGPPPRKERSPGMHGERGREVQRQALRGNRGPPIRVDRDPPRNGRELSSRDDRGHPSLGSSRGLPPRNNDSSPNRDQRRPLPREDIRESYRDGGRPPGHRELFQSVPFNNRSSSPMLFRDDPLPPRDARHDDTRGPPPRVLRQEDGRPLPCQFPERIGPPPRGYRSPSTEGRPGYPEEFRPPQLQRKSPELMEGNRLLPPLHVRQALLMRSRSPQRLKRAKTSREDDMPKRPRDDFREMDRPVIYGNVEDDHRKIPADERQFRESQRRPASSRDSDYPLERGMHRPPGLSPPPRYGSPRPRGPPDDHHLKEFPPRDRERQWEDPMHLVRMEELRRDVEYRKGPRGEPGPRPVPVADRREVEIVRGRGRPSPPDYRRERGRHEIPLREMDLRETRLRPIEARLGGMPLPAPIIERDVDRRERGSLVREPPRIGTLRPPQFRGGSAERSPGFLLPPGYRRPY